MKGNKSRCSRSEVDRAQLLPDLSAAAKFGWAVDWAVGWTVGYYNGTDPNTKAVKWHRRVVVVVVVVVAVSPVTGN